MKKLILFVIPFLVLCACGRSASKAETIPEEFTSAIVITDNGRQFEGVIKLDKTAWEYEFTAPESIKGMSVKYENDTLTTTLEGLSFSDKSDTLPESSPMLLIVNALEMCRSGKGITAVKEGKKVTDKGVVAGADFTVTFEESTPVSMEIGGEIAVTFGNEKKPAE